MATALSGAVIVEQEGDRVTYKDKCEKCGAVSSSTHVVTVSRGSKLTGGGFFCSKCGKRQEVVLEG